MSLSDCQHCWSTPCECGWDYRNWSIEGLNKHVKLFNSIILFKATYPDAKLSNGFSQKETEDDKRFMEFIRAWKPCLEEVK